mgnify:CR=1 FL=1
MATGRDARIRDATIEHWAVTNCHGTNQGLLQDLPEGSGVWELLHQSPVHLPEGARVRM